MKQENKKYHLRNSKGILSILIIELIFWGFFLYLYYYQIENIEEFRFEHPNFLWLFLILPLVNISWLTNRNWKNKALKKYASYAVIKDIFNGFSNNRSILKFTLFRVSLGLLIIAISNPQYGENERLIESKGIDIMIALDISKSMLAEDIVSDYNRLKIAKIGINKLIEELKGDHIGVVLFAGEAFKLLPITSDYFIAKQFIKSIQTEMISSQGTDIGNAINQCLTSFDSKRKTNKAIIIISDGEDHEEKAIEKAKVAVDSGLVVCTIGMGSSLGVPIPIYKGSRKIGNLKDNNNETVLTKLNEENLKNIAKAGNGTYSKVNGLNLQLVEIIERLSKIEKTTLKENKYSDYDDHFQWFLIPGLILIFINLIINEKRSKIEDRIKLFKDEI